jgi:hypothetical protein
MKKFSVDCINKAGEHTTVVVELDNEELADIRRNSRTALLIARCYAMRHANRLVPGFDPDPASVQQIH